MANSDIVNGFRPIRRKGGGQISVNRYYVDSNNSVAAIGKGTMMALVANTSSVGVPEVIIAAAGAVPIGPVESIEFNPDYPNRTYLPSSTSGYVYIADDVDLVMEAQSSGTAEDGDIGANANLTDAGCSTTTGMSGQEIDQSSITTTATLIFQILRLLNRPDNALGANAKFEVGYNIHAYAPFGNIAAASVAAGNFTGVHN
jgi:hypothetical protein